MKVLGLLSLIWGLAYASSTDIYRNIFDPELFTYDVFTDTYATHTPLPVDPNSAYVLSLPLVDYIDEMDVLVVGNTGTTYVEDNVWDLDSCFDNTMTTYCLFTTGPETTGLHITFSGGYLKHYLDFYGVRYMQLEKGTQPTEYTPHLKRAEAYVQGEITIGYSYLVAPTLNDIIESNLTAIDNLLQDVSDRIVVVEDGYTGNERITGRYEVVLEVNDDAQNITQIQLNIVIFDRTSPTIIGPREITVELADAVPLATVIESNLTFKDDYDGDLGSTYTIESSDYNSQAAGTYTVEISTIDASNNTSSAILTVHVRSTHQPVLQGPLFVQLYLSEHPTRETILDLFSAESFVSKLPLDIFIDSTNLPENMLSHGDYFVNLKSTDEHGNSLVRRIAIELIDDVPPLFMYGDMLVVPLGTTLSEGDILHELRVHYQELGFTIDKLAILEEDYMMNANREGIYPIRVSLTTDTGETFIHQGRIHVAQATLVEESSYPWVSILAGFLTTTALIGSFVVWRKR